MIGIGIMCLVKERIPSTTTWARRARVSLSRSGPFALLCAALSLSAPIGCQSPLPPSRILVDTAHHGVRLEANARSGRSPHAHPVKVSPDQLHAVLGTLTARPIVTASQSAFRYAKSTWSSQENRHFSEQAKTVLAQTISLALAQATPFEEVLFYLIEQRDDGSSLLTSGGTFVQDRELHLLIANFQHPTVGPTEIQTMKAEPLAVLAMPRFALDPGPFGRVQAEGGARALLTALPQHFRFDYRRLGERGADDQVTEQSSKASSRNASSPTAETRLQQLKEMRAEGLITPREFQTLKDRLLLTR